MSRAPRPPSQLFGALFERVAMAAIHPDGKAWADAVPLRPPAEIMRDFRATDPHTEEELRAFVAKRFSVDASPLSLTSTQGLALPAAIAALWPSLTRSAVEVPADGSLLALPRPYLAPGGRFTETYYWDCHFALLGLGPKAARDAAENFAHLIRSYGHIPNGSRSYYLSRSQPPFFFMVAAQTRPQHPQAAWARYLAELRAEHAWWMAGARQARPGAPIRRVVKMPDGALLNRYFDDRDAPRDESWREDVLSARAAGRPEREVWRHLRAGAESGWDFSSRWLDDRRSLAAIITADILPIDLNCILCGLEQAIAEGAWDAGDHGAAARYRRLARRRRAAIHRHLWNPATGLFDDYDWRGEALRGAVTAAAAAPLFFGLAEPDQAASTAGIFERDLLAPGGLLTTTLATGQQWDAPNGWAPLQWLAVRGLQTYGHDALAAEIAQRWVALVSDIHRRTGRFFEKYDVVGLTAGGGGEYAIQDGFGWTNGVTARLAEEMGAP